MCRNSTKQNINQCVWCYGQWVTVKFIVVRVIVKITASQETAEVKRWNSIALFPHLTTTPINGFTRNSLIILSSPLSFAKRLPYYTKSLLKPSIYTVSTDWKCKIVGQRWLAVWKVWIVGADWSIIKRAESSHWLPEGSHSDVHCWSEHRARTKATCAHFYYSTALLPLNDSNFSNKRPAWVNFAIDLLKMCSY